MTLVDLLGDTLVGKDGEVATASLSGKKAVALYFSAHWCPPCRGFTPKLAVIYEDLVENGLDFEIVFVSSDKDDESFKEYYGEQPWLALPFSKRDVKAALSKKFKVQGIPTLVIVDGNGDLITKNGRDVIVADPQGTNFPWKPKPLSELIGDTFVKHDGDSLTTVGKEAIAGKTLGIYFSAHWCPPCRQFTPVLIETYKKLKAQNKDFEIIFASSDKSDGEFNSYFKDMPWLSLPFSDRTRKEELSTHFEVRGIPSFVILDADFKVITTEGRSVVGADPEGLEFPWHPKPVNSVANADGLNDYQSLVIMMEGLDEAVVASASSALEKVATAVLAKDPEKMRFFYSKVQNPIAPQLRKLCSITDEPKMSVIVLDIPDDGGFYRPNDGHFDGGVTEENLNAFLDQVDNGAVKRQQLVRG